MLSRDGEDEEAHMFMRHLPEMLEHLALLPTTKEKKPKRIKDETSSEPPSESKI
jgi:hypothetical protein